jgi:hypothetical protein
MVNICLQRFCVKRGSDDCVSDDWRLSNPVGGCGMGVIFKKTMKWMLVPVFFRKGRDEIYTPLRRRQAS